MVNQPPVAAPRSMTGFATLRGEAPGWDWVWDLRAVNHRGLDLRLRLPDWIAPLEPLARAALQGRIARGSVTLSLRLNRRGAAAAATLDPDVLATVVAALAQVEASAEAAGVTLQHSTAAEVLGLKGVLDSAAEPPEDPAALAQMLALGLPRLLDDLQAMRAAEGRALAGVIAGQLDRIADLCAEAAVAAEARQAETAQTLRDNLARLLENAEALDETRLAQELALLAVKTDVTEEIDRLRAHVAAARELLAAPAPAGRRLDFLTQDFMREANTLCAKSGSTPLTRIGLDLKAVIDQMREQVQNVE
jgi:uncharacterized protein (TIGR00255 family)